MSLMSFAALRDRLPVLPPRGGSEASWPRIGRGGNSFSDDLALPDGRRLGVRVRITDRPSSGYEIDLRDCDDDPTGRFGLSEERARVAALLAIADALGSEAHAGWAERIDLLTERGTFIGADEPDDAGAVALAMARVYDAVLGALGMAWPGRVGAGSCSLGAAVELRASDEVLLTEVLPGGEGGRPDRAGASAWAGPILRADWPATPTLDGVVIEGQLREGSGGMGKRYGGDGVIRRYRAQRPLLARLAFDRVSNPPHGIDRAGPPRGTEVTVHLPGVERARPVEPFTTLELPTGATLVVETCGGAGWGFPGYGEIEWDPGEWFGSKPKGS